jgi:beta-glucosidase
MSDPSRRDFAKLAAALGVSPSARAAATAQQKVQFPGSFVWGCATASYQVEGAASEDGRKPSVWDTFSHTPGHTAMDHNGDVAADHYHRYKDDIQLLKWLGVKAYRFSIAWPRVVPDGSGQPNEKGIAFYERLVDELLANGIQPYATLFHWDLPQSLEDRFGGWRSRETAKYFGDYASFVSRRLSDRIGHFFTINEFSCFTDDGYRWGGKAPGLRLPMREVCQLRHHAVLAHGLAVAALRANARKPIRVGLAENAPICVPVIETEEHIAAARKAQREINAPFLTAVLEGKYLNSYLNEMGKDAPQFTPEDMKTIGAPLDFVGLNCYYPYNVRADKSPAGYAVVQHPSSYPHMSSEWLYIGPQILYWGPRHLSEIWGVKDVLITENGCSAADPRSPDGSVYDTDRVMFLRNYLTQAQRAVAEGWPLTGYFLWSLIDNFEWADGYLKRFGIVYVNYETQERIPKLSAHFYREVIARGAVV